MNEPGAVGAAAAFFTNRFVRASLYGLGLILVGIAIVKVSSGIGGGRLTLRPVYLLALDAIACFLAWKSGKLILPKIVHAAICCEPPITVCTPSTAIVWVNEGGTVVVHQIVGAVSCFKCPACRSSF